MAFVAPGKGRAIIESDGAGLRIAIPAKKQPFVTAFLGLWLIGWAVGEILVPYAFLLGAPAGPMQVPTLLFTTVWLAGWTLGGVWALSIFLWNITGKEIIELNATTLKRHKRIPLFGRSREYAVANIVGLRPAPVVQSFWPMQQNMTPLSFKDGTISFDYGRDTHHLGAGLDEADAKYVIGEMCKRVMSLCAKNAADTARWDVR